MRRTPWLVVALWTALCTAPAAADRPAAQPAAELPADATAADLEAMQGRWLREIGNQQGPPVRIEKSIDGTRGAVTIFDPQGNVVHSQTSTFRLRHVGGVGVYTFSTVTVTAGPNLGAQIPGPGSFLYKLDGDTMHEVWGLLDGDRPPPRTFVWKRVKNNP